MFVKSRRGLSAVVATVILVVVAVALAIAVYAITSGLLRANTTGVNLTQQTVIKTNASDGSGYVFIELTNHGPGSVQIDNITFTLNSGSPTTITLAPALNPEAVSSERYAIFFTSKPPVDGVSSDYDRATATVPLTLSCSAGADIASGRLVIPSGGSCSVKADFSAGMNTNWTLGETYQMVVNAHNNPQVMFQVQAQSA